MPARTLGRLIPSIPASDGAGVRLRRSLGQSEAARLDPFLMLDEFSSDDPNDYLAGFPDHPHRGFETVTYMLDGHMLHQDHLGNRGDLRGGDVQWMTAGRGIVHSEMPQQERGRMRGFQLWINLPAREKMKPPGYRDIPAAEIPAGSDASGVRVRAIAGRARIGEAVLEGPIAGLATEPLYFDVTLPAGTRFTQPVPAGHAAFLYAFEGAVQVPAGADGTQTIESFVAATLVTGDTIEVAAGPEGGRFILLAGKPIGEPVVQYGPFVMNSVDEIRQAIRDYQTGALMRGT